MPAIRVQRTIQCNVTPNKAFETIAEFNTWTTWSPWLCADPEAKVTVTENSHGVGAVYAWNGELVGEGSIKHVALEPPRRIEQDLRFVKPFRSEAQVTFDIQPAGEGCQITWSMDSSLPWFLFWMTGQMQGFIGMDYDRGLRMLKDWMETGEILSKTNIRGIETVGPVAVAGVRDRCSLKQIGPAMEKAFGKAKQLFATANLPLDGQMVSVYHKLDVKAQTFDFTSGYTLPASQIPQASSATGLATWSLPETKALRVSHLGSYDHLGNAWSAANQYARYKKLKLRNSGDFEIYLPHSQSESPADQTTEIYLPVR